MRSVRNKGGYSTVCGVRTVGIRFDFLGQFGMLGINIISFVIHFLGPENLTEDGVR